MHTEQDVEKKLLELTKAFLEESGELRVKREITLASSLQNNLGLDSLARAELFSRIGKTWSIELPDQLLTEADTLNDLLLAILKAKPSPQSRKSTAKRTPLAQNPKKIAAEWAKLAEKETLLEVLEFHAKEMPQQAYIYFQNEKGEEEILTYSDLQKKAKQVAASLIQRGLKPGETVALMLPTQLEFFYAFFGILYASGIPIPIYPPLRPQQLEAYAKQEAAILKNAEIRFLITFKQAETLSRLLKSFAPSLQAVLTVDLLLEKADSFKALPHNQDELALIQYTSGSTGQPKGVALSHYNLLSNIRAFGKAIKISPEDVAVSWLPLYHDFGLIGLVLGTLYYGIPLILMSPLSFLSRPEKWLWALHYHRGTISAAPNFAYELCARKIDDSALEGLDLSSWRIAANGAEPIYTKTYERFAKKYRAYGFNPQSFLPVYGLAESTVGLSVSLLGRLPRIDHISRQSLEEDKRAITLAKSDSSEESLDIISCGKALPGHAIRIVDEHHQELPERFVGLLEFKGPSTMQGYYNNPEATKALFYEGWCSSGDFAYMVEGEVFITGRKKDIIIKAGRNIYPTVIEEEVSDLPGIRRGCAIAFGINDPQKGTDKIIVVAETTERNRQKKDEIRKQMQEKLLATLDLAPDEIILVPPRSVPKTSSGKLQRSACKTLYLEGRLRHAPPWFQFAKLGLKSFLYKNRTFLQKGLKAIYTGYLILLVSLLALPFWLLIKLSPAAKAGILSKRAATLLRLLAGWRLQVIGLENTQQEGALIYVANHASYVDAIFLMSFLPAGVRFVGKKELFSVPLLKDVLIKLQHIPVDRMDFTQGLAQTRKLEELIKSGVSIAIFPEGTFSYAAGLRPFKLGAFKIAAAAQTAICPLALKGTRQLLRSGSYLMRPGLVTCTVGEPLPPSGDEWQDIQALKNQTREFISAHCGEASLDFSQPLQES